MRRVIFDTNVYGMLLEEPDREKTVRRIINKKEVIVYGYHPIRKELRNIPKTTSLSKKTRCAILDLYDAITETHQLHHDAKILALAKE